MSGAASFHGETDHPQSRYYAAMNLKKLANWSWNNSSFAQILLIFTPKYTRPPVFAWQKQGVL